MLGIGLAATRDIVSFFRYARRDDAGTPNPVAGAVTHAISPARRSPATSSRRSFTSASTRTCPVGSCGTACSRTSPRDRRRSTSVSPRRAAPARCTSRAASPCSGGPRTPTRLADAEAGEPARSLPGDPHVSEGHRGIRIDRILGPADVAGAGWHGRGADIPLPDNVRRYYMPGTTHGGGRGGFQIAATAGQPVRAAGTIRTR